MHAIETLEFAEKNLIKTLSFLGDPNAEEERYRETTIRNIKMAQDQLEEVRWGLAVLKAAMGRAGETITLPKEG